MPIRVEVLLGVHEVELISFSSATEIFAADSSAARELFAASSCSMMELIRGGFVRDEGIIRGEFMRHDGVGSRRVRARRGSYSRFLLYMSAKLT